MSEKETIKYLAETLDLDNWWKEMVNGAAKPIDLDQVSSGIPYTEIRAAKEIHRKIGNHLSYVPFTDTWYAWNGIIHVPCTGNAVALKIAKLLWENLAKALDFIQDDFETRAKAIANSGELEATEKAAKMRKSYEVVFGSHRYFRDRLASTAGISALAQMMKTECDVDSDYFEDDTRWFVMRNYVLDLEALKEGNWVILPHSPERNVTKYFDADYDPELNLKHWDHYLERSIPDKSQRDYLQVAVGAGFLGIGRLRAIISIVGPPGTGKSIFLDTIGKLGNKGAKYSKKPDGKSIMIVSGQNFSQDEYRGARFVYISEPPNTGKTDDDFLKAITGDGDVTTRTLNKQESMWNPQCLLCIASNDSLKINFRDEAIVERVQEIRFPVKFLKPGPGVPPEREMVRDLDKLILRDRSRVLTWIIAGMRRFVNDGMILSAPDSVVVARDQLVSNGSTALQWLNEMIEDGFIKIDYDVPNSHMAQVSEAYQKYTMWCQEAGERKPLSRKFFSKDIQAKYGETVKSGGTRFPGLSKTEAWIDHWDNAWMRN
jgi:phage/plasmid-associated DNA primase